MKKIIRTTDMSKEDYNKPKMRVIKLQHMEHLLSASDVRCTNEPSSDPTESPAIWHWQVD